MKNKKKNVKKKKKVSPFFTEQLQWLLPTFNLYFQRSPQRKPVGLLEAATRDIP